MNHAAAKETQNPLLVELVTEELPPKALSKLGKAFADGITSGLAQQHLLAEGCTTTYFATPRRLAVRLSHVLKQAPDQPFTEKLMPVKIGLDDNGQATAALKKKLDAKGWSHLQPENLHTESDGKQDYLYAKGTAQGAQLTQGLQKALEEAVANLPIPKVMRYQLADGQTSVKFVRPAHQLVALLGADIVPITLLGLQAGRTSSGHRFMGQQSIEIQSADTYETQLTKEGRIIPSFEVRRDTIREQLEKHANALGHTIGNDPETWALLDEVTALVEHPTVYTGQFDPAFLEVPAECLILTMRLNQKYFPLFDPASGKLTHQFLIVSNMEVADPSNIVEGNERVVRPRLADAQFFYNTDRKTSLASRVEALESRVYHNKLGSQRERIERVRAIARYVAENIGADTNNADRAALLAKADLNTNMVGEFPELQGIMGGYYAQADNEPASVVNAITGQYQIRLESPVNTHNETTVALFIAERAETLIGIWGIGLVPSGERDPYGLRRAALGIISAFEQLAAGAYLQPGQPNKLTITGLLEFARKTFSDTSINDDVVAEVSHFIYERYRNLLASEFDRTVIDAVLELAPPLNEVHTRIQACTAFAELPEAQSLASANKRIVNLLKKANINMQTVDPQLLEEPAEQALEKLINELEPRAHQQFKAGDFRGNLTTLSGVRDAVDQFFNDVMVMAPDPALRDNRLALLGRLKQLMNQVADISRLAQ
ncbi:glycine--tRNA ligase subunit beta [Pusillimonas sp. DMV24BSW_D]|uniref:glycine--tRNA ligase subunit beta n=1 Tax=Neopusillimonas aestuarii TaxID=2716226 RepID=UPI00140C5988|nr:glycine--tRNA ligase subunit beta [Pusillimonas sp. DMV24BSW_D]QIM50157.1 glycine--tRNA ligase subunit beta [Pusillimonas sp. DMV24BSW_D]